MGILRYICLGVIISLAVVGYRLYKSLPSRQSTARNIRQASVSCNLAVFLGSGGHTSEILSLLSAIDFARYSRRIYYISEGDTLSMQKAVDLECAKAADANKGTHSNSAAETPYSFIVIPRARHVHQPLLTTPFTAMVSLAASIWHITIAPILGRPAAEVLLLNGPGTCFVLCIAAYVNRILGLRSPKLIYVESFTRVRRLSLSGKLLRPLVDRFVVQWPDLLKDGKRGEYRGWLVYVVQVYS